MVRTTPPYIEQDQEVPDGGTRPSLLGTLSTRTGKEDDALPEVESRISIAVRMRIGCIIPSCPLLVPRATRLNL